MSLKNKKVFPRKDILESGSLSELRALKKGCKERSDFYWKEYLELSYQREAIMDSLLESLQSKCITDYPFSGWQRAVKYRYSLQGGHGQLHHFARPFFAADFLVVFINPINSLSGAEGGDIRSFFKRSTMTTCSASFFLYSSSSSSRVEDFGSRFLGISFSDQLVDSGTLGPFRSARFSSGKCSGRRSAIPRRSRRRFSCRKCSHRRLAPVVPW